MDITVYLPDELGRWAKEAGLNLSGILRGEVEAERRRRDAVASELSDSTTYELYVEDGDARYTVRLHGTQLLEESRDVEVYLGEDEQVYVYETDSLRLHEGVDTDALRDWLPDDENYIAVMGALGEEAVIDIGEAGS